MHSQWQGTQLRALGARGLLPTVSERRQRRHLADSVCACAVCCSLGSRTFRLSRRVARTIDPRAPTTTDDERVRDARERCSGVVCVVYLFLNALSVSRLLFFRGKKSVEEGKNKESVEERYKQIYTHTHTRILMDKSARHDSVYG